MIRPVAVFTIVAALPSWAQTNRESYRAPYQAWRQSAPALEQDAAAPTAAFVEQARASAEAAQKFFSARAAFLNAAQPDAVPQTAWASKPLVTAESLLSIPQNLDQLLAVRAAKVTSEIGGLKADDKDAGLRRVRQAMERERAALRALTDSLGARKAALAELNDRTDDAEIQRATVFQTLNAANGRRAQLADHVKREASDWGVYYRNLSEAAAARTLSTAAAPSAAPAKILRPVSNGQIPLSRYSGEWDFPNKGLFYGPQPESVELTVQETNGGLSGTLAAKFVMPARTVQFTFQGPAKPGKSQTFALQTSDGATGSVELIPGSAINLIEVNFQAASTLGNFILVKK